MGLALAIGASENSFDMYKNQKNPIQSLHIGFTWYKYIGGCKAMAY